MINIKKICITGSSGFIGSSLVQYLYKLNYDKEYDFILIDRKDNPYDDVYKDNTKFYLLDINDGLPDLDNVEAVIHLAALPSVRESDTKFKQVVEDNILCSYNIIKKCIDQWKPEKLIIASSSSVYDGRCNETNFGIRILSPYAQTKKSVEDIVKMYINNGLMGDIDCALLRIFTVYGPRQRDELAIHAIIDSVMNDKVFTLYGDGSQRRDFSYIDDVCSAIEHFISSWDCIENEEPIYNIGTGKNHSINEIINFVCKELNKTITIKYEEPTIYDTMYTKADVSKIALHTHWEAKMDFQEGIRKQIEWLKKKK